MQKNVDAFDVKRFLNLGHRELQHLRDRGHASHLHPELGENLMRVVSFAKEAPVDDWHHLLIQKCQDSNRRSGGRHRDNDIRSITEAIYRREPAAGQQEAQHGEHHQGLNDMKPRETSISGRFARTIEQEDLILRRVNERQRKRGNDTRHNHHHGATWDCSSGFEDPRQSYATKSEGSPRCFRHDSSHPSPRCRPVADS